MIFLQYGQIDVLDGAFVLIDKTDPHAYPGRIGGLHYAGAGNAGFSCGSAFGLDRGDAAGVGGGRACGFTLPASPAARGPTNSCTEAKLALDDDLRLKVVRKMYELRFREAPPARRSVEQHAVLKDLAFGKPTLCWRNATV